MIESTDDPTTSELISTELAPTKESTIGGDAEVADGEEAPDGGNETQEQMMLRMGTHVQMARVQCALYRHFVDKAINGADIGVPHSERTYTFVADHGQNIGYRFSTTSNLDVLITTPSSVCTIWGW